MTAEPLLPPITCPEQPRGLLRPAARLRPDRIASSHSSTACRAGRSPVILRVDLPARWRRTSAAAAQTALSIGGTGGVAIDWVAWVDDADSTTRDDLSSATFVAELAVSTRPGRASRSARNLSTNGRMWWSHSCTDPVCCPIQGTPLDTATMNAVRAEYVFAGYAPLGSREELAARIARDELRAAEVQQVLRRRTTRREPTQRWRDTQVRFLTGLLLPRDACDGPGDPDDGLHRRPGCIGRWATSGFATSSCTGSSCADTTATAAGRPRCETLCDAVRTAPAGRVRPGGDHPRRWSPGCAGRVRWRRCASSVPWPRIPSYRLAGLAARLMAQGSDPRLWRESLAGLPESECRNPGRR